MTETPESSTRVLKIISVVGARPNFMKVAPLHRVFSKSGCIDSIIVHTGQHYDERMSQVFFDQLGLPKPHHFLGIGGGSHTEQTANIMLAFEKVLDLEKPDLVIVVGDVNSTVACALTAVKKHIKVAHVEAGLRSGDRSMPEEINRIVTDAISDMLFVSEQSGIDNLLAEGVPKEKIHFVGNIMIDSLVHVLPQVDHLNIHDILRENQLDTSDSPLPASGFRLPASDFILVTMHRPSNVDTEGALQKIIQIVTVLSKANPIIFSLHPRTRKNLEKFGLFDDLYKTDNVTLTHPLGYLEFIKVMKDATLVVTDSGGIQEETTYLKVPCITFRESTERPSTVEIGSNVLIEEVDVKKALEIAGKILSNVQESIYLIPPNWDGKTAERIEKTIRNLGH
ncbi:MAG: UDP-N-acetylglucosamine 2-epimerase (non-hydrolyzing) [Saprospiraceae bacterium]|nr:UDP-N-acetylglucosamine 2-epimerase (non-hydrolyzing) [Saprospiraceae bacterium]